MKFVPPTNNSGTEEVIITMSSFDNPNLPIKNSSNSNKDFLSIDASKFKGIG